MNPQTLRTLTAFAQKAIYLQVFFVNFLQISSKMKIIAAPECNYPGETIGANAHLKQKYD